MKLDLKVLIATAVAGLVAFFIDQALYAALVDALPRPVLIAILVVVLAAICCIVISVMVSITDGTQDEFLFLDSRAMICVGLVVCLLIMFPATMLLEWIYDHEEVKPAGASSYIFILDESGSMASNDPNYERYKAVETVANTMSSDFPYAVYMFSNDCVRIRDMASVSAGKVYRPSDADNTMMGGTYISYALTCVFNDIQSGQLNVGDHPQVILLTDGYASDMNFFMGKGILKDYSKAGIMISAVGLGTVDEDLMTEIAEKTGGQYIRVDNASQLSQGFSNATYVDTQRDLLSVRNTAEKNVLYLILRIVFLTLIGAMVAFVKALSCANSDSTALILIEGAAAALVGALLMEIGLAVGLPVFLCRLLYWLLLAVTPHLIVQRVVRNVNERRALTAQEILSGRRNPTSSSGGNRQSSAGRIDWS